MAAGMAGEVRCGGRVVGAAAARKKERDGSSRVLCVSVGGPPSCAPVSVKILNKFKIFLNKFVVLCEYEDFEQV